MYRILLLYEGFYNIPKPPFQSSAPYLVEPEPQLMDKSIIDNYNPANFFRYYEVWNQAILDVALFNQVYLNDMSMSNLCNDISYVAENLDSIPLTWIRKKTEKYQNIHFNEKFLDDLQDSINGHYRYFCMTLELIFIHKITHMNALVFDIKRRKIIRFEPNGSTFDTELYLNFDQNLREFFSVYLSDFEYVSPRDYAAEKGVQYLAYKYDRRQKKLAFSKESAEGYCVVWSLLFIHYCIINRNFTPEEINQRLEQKSPEQLHDLVQRYASWLERLLKQ